MRLGHEQRVPGEQRPDVEEREDLVLVEHDVRRALTGDDLAEQAGQATTIPHAPPSRAVLILPGRHHPPPSRRLAVSCGGVTSRAEVQRTYVLDTSVVLAD